MSRAAQDQLFGVDLSGLQEQLAAAHNLCDKLEQQNEFFRSELLKRGVVIEGDEDCSFALGGVPDQPMTSVSFTDSAGGTAENIGQGLRSDSGGSLAGGLRFSLLQQVRDSDAACGKLEQLLDKLQSQLSSSDLTSEPPAVKVSPFAAVAAGTREDQLRNAKLLCGEVNQNVSELRTRFATVISTLQTDAYGDGEPDRQVEEPQPQFVREKPPAWRDSFDVSPVRQSIDLAPKPRPSVSFHPGTRPAYSARMDHFSPENGGASNLAQGLQFDDEDAASNPLFDQSGERIPGTRGISLTRASVAAQMFKGMDKGSGDAEQEQLKQNLLVLQQEVSLACLPK